MTRPLGRRDFLRTTAAVTAAVVSGSALSARDEKKPKLKKAVKYSMIRVKDATHRERFELAKKCGFLGVEIDRPSPENLDELVAASKASGIPIHGVIDSVHWDSKYQLGHPDPAVRTRGTEALIAALKDAKTVGADTVLLVPGVVRTEEFEGKKVPVTYEQCYERSQAEVRKALPVAEKMGVKIAIEVVWNNFITKPEQLVQYVDDFKSEYVGAYFDCSNMLKYGVPAAEWIRKLGKRMVKFDFKGFKKPDKWVEIGEGDEDWPEVLKALAEVGYNGWATAEVGGGGEERLKTISAQMDKVLGL
ncbi:MAG TPA: sugar phosphate isomerase/epimerase family protein [Gemmataceae bacterium]|nr:sugar phosphate isomerase/epimerase family protein [Gemmataceae bacterium]